MTRIGLRFPPGSSTPAPAFVTSFADGIVKDLAAVRAAIVSLWSNGQAEGQMTKPKLVKRQMTQGGFDINGWPLHSEWSRCRLV